MKKNESQKILNDEIEVFRNKSYSELSNLIDVESYTKAVTSEAGINYQIEIQAFWDDKPKGNIRVLGSIDDGGVRAFAPLTVDFIKSPSNEFIGE